MRSSSLFTEEFFWFYGRKSERLNDYGTNKKGFNDDYFRTASHAIPQIIISLV